MTNKVIKQEEFFTTETGQKCEIPLKMEQSQALTHKNGRRREDGNV